MDIDLCDRGISRLCFSAEETSEEEAKVASAVSVLLADRNGINCVSGLSAVFVNLVELRLSHNDLGATSTPYYRVNQSLAPVIQNDTTSFCRGSCCDGVASWISALPSTLEVLDVTYNHLHSFLECTCSCASSSTATVAIKDRHTDEAVADSVVRALRHRCPFAVPLFFSAERFPRLRELHLGHNAFAVSLRESDEMMAALEDARAAHPSLTVAAATTFSLVDLGGNEGIAAANCFFCCPATSPEIADPTAVADTHHAAAVKTPDCTFVKLNGTGLEDLQGIASLGVSQPSSRWSLQLHPCPLSRSVLSTPPAVLLQLLQMVVPSLQDTNAMAAALMKPSRRASGVDSVLDALQSLDQLDALEELVREEVGPRMEELRGIFGSCERWTVVLTYACLLHQVVPSLDVLDTALAVEWCERVILCSLHQLLVEDTSTQDVAAVRRLPAGAPPLHPPAAPVPSAPQLRGLGSLASCVAPELRSRVVVGDEQPEGRASGAADAEAPVMAGSADRTSTVCVDATTAIPSTSSTSGSGAVTRPGRFKAALAALRPSRSSSTTTPAATRSSSAHSTFTGSSSQLSYEVVEDESATTAGEERAGEDLFTPAGLSAEDKATYEALCVEARELQAAVLASNERCRDFQTQTDALQHQLTQDRTLVADQLKEISRLREEKAQLEQSLARQKHKLEKRQKEVAYGVTAIQSREAAAREKAAMERIAAREKEVAKRERLLRQRAARTGALAVEYNSSGPSGQRKKLRSEVLREAAVRKRLAEQENKDPLAYTPAHFKSDARRSTPRTSPDQLMPPPPLPPTTTTASAAMEEEKAYFELYGALGAAPQLQEAADHYVAQLPAPQQQQLREASTQLQSGSGSREGAKSQRRHRSSSSPSPPATRDSPFSNDATRSAEAAARLATSPESGRDLSTLSLSELLDAAAAIRQKQLALQQLQQQWRQPPGQLEEGHAAQERVAREKDSGSSHLEDTSDGPQCHEEPSPTAAAVNAHANSPFPSADSEELRPGSAQELFDMILAQRSSSRGPSAKVNGSGEKALPPTRSPFSTQHDGDGNSPCGTTMDNTPNTSNGALATRPQINRALFH